MTPLLRCPHCAEGRIGVLRKLAMGPAVPTACAACKKRFGVPWWSVVVMVPWLGIMGAAVLVLVGRFELPEVPGLLVSAKTSAAVTLLGVSWLALSLAWIFVVPLVPR